MLTLAAAGGLWGDAGPSTSSTHRLPLSPTQVVEFPAAATAAAQRRGSEHKQDIVMHLGVKTYLKCLRGFQRKHLNVGIFFPAELCSVLCDTLWWLLQSCTSMLVGTEVSNSGQMCPAVS